ncbi:MAG: hypothetical protein R6W75_12500 [Smithellaceae bacterium]
MKRLIGIVGLMAVLMCLSAGTLLAESGIPDVKGKWVAKSYTHHHEKQGFFHTAEAGGVWIIKEQQGRFFYGERTYVKKQITDKKTTEGFSGVFSRDGKRIYIVDHDEDTLIGEMISDDRIELVIMNDGDKNDHSRVGLIEINKIK